MAFTYHIALTGTAYTEFIPTNDVKVTWQEYPGEIFLRPVLEEIKIGALRNPTLYASIETMFNDSDTFGSQVKLILKRDGTDEYFFRSSISSAKLDSEKKLFLFTPEPNDKYQDVLDYYDKQYTSLSLVYVAYVWQRPSNAFVNVDFTIFGESARSILWTNSEGTSCYARLRLSGYTAVAGKRIMLIIKNLSFNNFAPRMRIVDGSYATISDLNIINADGIYTFTLTAGSASVYVEFEDVDSGASSGTLDYDLYYYKDHLVVGDTLKNVIDSMLANTGSSLTVKSTYLFNDVVPSVVPSAIASYITSNPTNDYVTEGAAVWNHLWFGRVDSLTTDNADTHELSLRDLMDMLRVKLRTFWYIDSDGYFRIEHQRYFREWTSQINLITSAYTKFKPEVDNHLYDYHKDNIVNTIICREQNEGNEEFIAHPIYYDIIKTTTNSISIAAPKISTDAGWIVENADDADPSGFILMQCDYFGTTYAAGFCESEFTPGLYLQNGHLAWSYLFPRYWKYFAEADTADINDGSTLTAEHVKEFLRQSGIRFYTTEILNWRQPVTLSRGTGWIKRIEHYLSSGFYMIEVGFDPYTVSESTTVDSSTITVDSTLITVDG